MGDPKLHQEAALDNVDSSSTSRDSAELPNPLGDSEVVTKNKKKKTILSTDNKKAFVDQLRDQANDLLRIQSEKMLLLENKLVELDVNFKYSNKNLSGNDCVNSDTVLKNGPMVLNQETLSPGAIKKTGKNSKVFELHKDKESKLVELDINSKDQNENLSQNATGAIKKTGKNAKVFDLHKDQKSKLVELNVDSKDQKENVSRNANVNANAVTKNGPTDHSRNATTRFSQMRQKTNEFRKNERAEKDDAVRKRQKITDKKPDRVVYAWKEKKGTTEDDQKNLEKSLKHHRFAHESLKKPEESKKELKEENNEEVKVNLEKKKSNTSKMSPSNNFPLTRTKSNVSPGLDTDLSDLPNLEIPDASNNKPKENKLSLKENEMSDAFLIARSKTMPTLNRVKMSQQKIGPTANEGERLRLAKEMAERAIKYKKIFTIQGGYSTIRQSLRKRGWVEKFYKIPLTLKKYPGQREKKASDEDDNNNEDDDDALDDDDDDDIDDMDKRGKVDDQPKVPPWEEEDGIYGIMSRLVRNVNPTLFWVLKRDAIDYRFLNKDQMVNHYCKAGSFTTKVGLCINMRNVVWFDNTDHNTFFPRCYRLSHDEDKDAFIDDYRLTACMCIVKVAVRQNTLPDRISEDDETNEEITTDPETAASKSGEGDIKGDNDKSGAEVQSSPKFMGLPQKKRKKTRAVIPVRVLETAVYQCEKFLASKEHEDIDMPVQTGQLTDQQWDDLIQWYYQLVHEEGYFMNVPLNLINQCESLTQRLAQHCPQFEMDGIRNVWIVKPGARSRGRGIICYEKLEDMLKLVASQVVKKDGKYVVQKYIERPLLIYNTKFDIRQWFLVTDWNPLTLWFYRDSYLRFCSQQFTLEDFDQSIHLSNNAIQKHYKNGPRSPRLPEENMWTHHEFKEYLKSKKQPNVWDEVIYPSMKKAIICSLLVTQDLVEYRKSSFELYGADFMLTEDLSPWLIEINSSPSMESSTAVTAKLCTAVLDDTLKVVIDRKLDGNCDIGAFELAYKQALVTVPPYIGVNLCVEGQSVRKPANTAIKPQPKQSDQSLPDSLFTTRAVTMKQTLVDRSQETRKSVAESSPVKNDKSRMFEAATAKLHLASTNSKEITAKVSTFRSSSDEKNKTPKFASAVSQNTSSIESASLSGTSSWPRACLLCGRGGGLQLDSADPNCRCQQDSVLVTGRSLSHEPLIISSISLQHGKSKAYMRNKLKSSVLRHSITPTQPLASDDDEDSAVNKDDERPVSAHTESSLRQSKHHTSRGKSMKRRNPLALSLESQSESQSFYNQHFNYKLQPNLSRPQENLVGSNFSYTSGNWQNVVYDKPQPYISPTPHYSTAYSVHPGFINSLPFASQRSAVGLRGNTSQAIVKMWPNISSQGTTNLLINPLGAMVHRRLQLNVKKSKGSIL